MKFIEEILKNQEIEFTKIEKDNLSCNVFFVETENQNYILKIAKNKFEKQKLKNELYVICNCNFDFVPELFKSGKYKETDFLIYKKPDGKQLLQVWKSLKTKEKEEILQKLTQILRRIHKNSQLFLQKQFCDLNWQTRWKCEFKKLICLFENFNLNTLALKNFLEFNLDEIFKQNNYAVINNNINFNNIIYDKENLFLIDFENARFCPIDYELNSLCFNLKKLNLDNQEQTTISEDDISFILKKIKEFYPEIFDIPFIEDRLKIYNFYSNIKYALKNDEPSLIEVELESFNQFCQKFAPVKRSVFDNIKLEILELCRIYKNENNFDIYNSLIKKVVFYANSFGKKFKLNCEVLNLASLLFNSSILNSNGNFYDYHISSCDKAKEILEKYNCDKEIANKVVGCILNHKSTDNATTNDELCFANAFNACVFDDVVLYCEYLLIIHPKIKFDELKTELTSRLIALNKYTNKFKKYNLEKNLKKVYDKFFKTELNDKFYGN